MARPRKSSPAEMEARRVKNREFMRTCRQRQRQTIQEMTVTVQQLEKQYAELSPRSTAADEDEQAPNGKLQRKYAEAITVTKRLGAEKLHLRTMVQQNAAWELLVQRALDFEASSLASARLFQSAATVEVEMIDEIQAAEELGFYPLTEWDLTRAILDHHQEIHRVETRLLQPAEIAMTNGVRTHRMQAFGWDIVQRVEKSVMEFVFTKRFTGLNVLKTMHDTWTNDVLLERFRTVKAETCRLEVLQKMNLHAFVFVRDVDSLSDISIFRSVFVHFLVEAAKEFPVGTSDTNSQTVLGTGYVLGTQSVDTDRSLASLHESDEKLAWAELCLTTEMYDVVDPATGETSQEVFWAGRTDYCTEEDAMRNAADNLQGLLRWEMHIVAPALTLPLLKS